LAKATSAFRAALVKMSLDKIDAEAEFAYGVLSAEELSHLYDSGRKIAWPLFGVGKISEIVLKLKRGDMDRYNPMNLTESDIVKALTVLDQPCRNLSDLCQEGIDHILQSLELGKYSKQSAIKRMFSKARQPDPSPLSPDFISHFDSGVEAFRKSWTDGLSEFYDEKTQTLSHLIFIVVFNKFLLCAVAEEIHSVILLVDSLRSQNSLTRKRIIIPKLAHLREMITNFFHRRNRLGIDISEPHDLGRVKRTA
jgi:hypothetical protein